MQARDEAFSAYSRALNESKLEEKAFKSSSPGKELYEKWLNLRKLSDKARETLGQAKVRRIA